jgi:hypothetical protein
MFSNRSTVPSDYRLGEDQLFEGDLSLFRHEIQGDGQTFSGDRRRDQRRRVGGSPSS